MVIKYNSRFLNKTFINKREVKELTPENINFLLSLGLKLNNNGIIKRRRKSTIR